MYAMHAGVHQPGRTMTLIERLNGPRHELALRVFMVIVLAHWAEHLLQAFQIYALGWPVPEARGALGYFFPWLVKSETLHYGYALVMLAGLWLLRSGFTGVARPSLVDDRARHPVLSPHRARAAADPGDPRSEFLRPAGADQPRAALGASGRAAPLLQHDGVHPHGHRDVLPHVSAVTRGRLAEVQLCVAPATGSRGRVTAAPFCCSPARRCLRHGCGVRPPGPRVARRREPSNGRSRPGHLSPVQRRWRRSRLRDSARQADSRGAGCRVEGHMAHPGMAPVIATAAERDAGVYQIRLQFTMRGSWILLVTGELPDGRRINHRIDVNATGPSD